MWNLLSNPKKETPTPLTTTKANEVTVFTVAKEAVSNTLEANGYGPSNEHSLKHDKSNKVRAARRSTLGQHQRDLDEMNSAREAAIRENEERKKEEAAKDRQKTHDSDSSSGDGSSEDDNHHQSLGGRSIASQLFDEIDDAPELDVKPSDDSPKAAGTNVNSSATRRGTLTGIMQYVFGSGTAPSSDQPVVAQVTTKETGSLIKSAETRQRMLDEDRKKLLREQLFEQNRLDNEPEIAKAFRKALTNASHVGTVLNDVFNNPRFGNFNHLKKYTSYKLQFDKETPSNSEACQSLVEWKIQAASFKLKEINHTDFETFKFLDSLGDSFEGLGNLWTKIFSHTGELQQLERLNYFFAVFARLTEISNKFDAYMKKSETLNQNKHVVNNNQEEVLEEKKADFEKFIAIVNRFSARVMMSYILLDGLKTQMKRAENIQRKLRHEAVMELPDEIALDIAEQKEEFQATAPEWQVNFETAEQKVKNLRKEETQLTLDIQYGDECYDAETAHNKLVKIKKELETEKEKLEEARTAQPEWKRNLDKIQNDLSEIARKIDNHQEGIEIQEDIDGLRRKLKLLQKEADKATFIFSSEMNKVYQAQRVAYDEMQEIRAREFEDEKEELEQQRIANQARKKITQEAKAEATQFLIEYVTQPGSVETLSFSEPIQALLPAVNIALLELWLRDQPDGLTIEDTLWMAEMIQPEVRTFTLRLSREPKATFLLESNNGDMLEVVSIPIDGVELAFLTHEQQKQLAQKITSIYASIVNNTANEIVSLKADASKTSEQATNLLNKIAVDVELKPNALAWFGLYLLVYLQNTPEHNFQDVNVYNDTSSSSLWGEGSRLLRILMRVVQKNTGYHLRNAKVIHDKMSQRMALSLPEVEESIRASLFSFRNTEVTSSSSSNNFSSELEKLFSLPRKNGTETYKPLKLAPEDYDVLVREVSGRYFENLKALVMAINLDSDQINLMAQAADLLEQLPYENRLSLMNIPVIPLMMVRAKINFYIEDKKRNRFSNVASQTFGVDRKTEKIDFLQSVFSKLRGELSSPSLAADKKLFMLRLYERVKNTKLNKHEDLVPWLKETILFAQNTLKKGGDTLKAMMWLSNESLDNVLSGVPFFGAEEVRKLAGSTYKTFESTNSENNLSHIDLDVSIEDASEFFIMIASQAAILSFHELMLVEKNERLIVIASQQNWFLRLRFWSILMVEENILPPFDPSRTAAQNRSAERNILKIINNMMNHAGELANFVTSYFSQTDSKGLHEHIEQQMSSELKVKFVCVMMAAFFVIYFGELASKTNTSSVSKDIIKYFNHILALAGFTFNQEDKAMLFSIMANFICENSDLLLNLNVESCLAENIEQLRANTLQTQHIIPNKEGSALDVGFFTSSAKVTLIQDNPKRAQERLSTPKVLRLIHSVKFRNSAESMLLQDAVARMKR